MKNKSKERFRVGDLIRPIMHPPVFIWMQLTFKIKTIVNEAINNKEPALFIGAHYSLEDPILADVFTHRIIRFIAADTNYDTAWKRWLFPHFSIIPFAKDRMDLNAIRELKKGVSNGFSVGLYPEGTRTWDGVQLPVIDSIAKLIKLLNVPVYNIMLDGAYLIKPRWAKNYRKGTTQLSIKKVITKDDIKSMSWQEVLAVVEKCISHNAYEYQRIHKIPFINKNKAEYIEKVVYKCPECLAVDSFVSHENLFHCKKCNIEFKIDDYGFIKDCRQFDNLASWNRWQAEFIDEIIDTNLPIINSDVRIDLVSKDGSNRQMRKFVINQDSIEINDNKIPMNSVESVSVIFTDTLLFYVGKTKYKVKLQPKSHSSILLLENILLTLIKSHKNDKINT